MSKQHNTLSDKTLAHLAQAGDRAAFEALCERYLPSIYNRLQALLPSQAANDRTQAVFMAALGELDQYSESTFHAWIVAITRRKVAEYYQEQKRQAELPLLDKELDTRADQETRQADHTLVKLALEHLPAHQQEIILLRFAERLPFEHIAATLGLSLEAVRFRYRQAVAAIAEKVESKK